jgi:hypothetical protein
MVDSISFDSYWSSSKPVLGSTPDNEGALRQSAANSWNAALEHACKLLDLSSSQLALLGGEMTSCELRATKAVLENRAVLIKKLTTKEGRIL